MPTNVSRISQYDQKVKVLSNRNTQEQLHELHTGPEFDGAYRMAQTLTVVSVCLMFSSVMPLLYPVCFVYLMFKFYWSKF